LSRPPTSIEPVIVAPHLDSRGEEDLLRQLETLERLLDRQFSVAGLRFGWDSLIGLVPVVGDTLTTGLSGWLIWKAHQMGVPGHVKARMIANAGFDYALGLVPLVGDVGDAFFKANTRNVRLLKAHLQKSGRLPSTTPSRRA
jgi:hypothetical protein